MRRLLILVSLAGCSTQPQGNEAQIEPLTVARIINASAATDVRACRSAQLSAEDWGSELRRRVDNVRAGYGSNYSAQGGSVMSDEIRSTGLAFSQPVTAAMRRVRHYCTVAQEVFTALASASDIDPVDREAMEACVAPSRRLNQLAEFTLSSGKSDRPEETGSVHSDMRSCWRQLQQIANARGVEIWPSSKMTETRSKLTPTQTPTPIQDVSKRPDLTNFKGSSIPDQFLGRWDERIADKCEAREARYTIASTQVNEFEVKSDVVGVRVVSPQVTEIVVTGDGDEGQYFANYKLELKDGGERLVVDGGIPQRRCPQVISNDGAGVNVPSG